ncbi:hypothetical protein BDZ94DRAFT_1258045 [Collybia nuda]|uniref:Uncharacterized protein n=1 Tax=Collybia nuda TaxID=64659 RepID=A0A9P6CKF2_9AGAR|nr:hypothetical protein BDZ94DRAFT_1258045 [Collybia nuda]
MVPLVRFALWPLLFRLAQAGLVNITVDDSSGDPRSGNSILYNPPSVWNTAEHCSSVLCNARPDIKIVYSGSWHEATFDPQSTIVPITASFEFQGSAVYVYCVLATSIAFPSGKSEMSFSIDGQLAGTFSRSPPGPWGYQYNVPVFSHSALSPGTHRLDITNGNIGQTQGQTLLMLDNIVYSFDDQGSPATTTATVVVPGPADPGGISPPSGPSTPTSGVPTESSPPSGSQVPFPSIGSSNHSASGGQPIPGQTIPGQPNFSQSIPSISSLTNSNTPTSPTLSPGGTSPTDPSLSVDPSHPSNSPSPNPPSTLSSSSRGRIIGAVLGTAFGLLVIGIIACLLYRRRRRQARTTSFRASGTSQTTRLITTDTRSSFGTPPSPDPLISVQPPPPVYNLRTITFATDVASPVYSPTSPGQVDPFPVSGGYDPDSGRRYTGQGWMVASDSKRTLLEANGTLPPAYGDPT